MKHNLLKLFFIGSLALMGSLFAAEPVQNHLSYETQNQKLFYNEAEKINVKISNPREQLVKIDGKVKVSGEALLFSQDAKSWQAEITPTLVKGEGFFYVKAQGQKTKDRYIAPASYSVTILPSKSFNAPGLKFSLQFNSWETKGVPVQVEQKERTLQHPIKVSDGKGNLQTKTVKIYVRKS